MPFNDVSLRIVDVRCGFKRSEFSLAVDQQARGGEMIAAVGRNGEGKSTLLHALSLTHPVLAGTLKFCISHPEETQLTVGANAKLDERAIRFFRNRFIGCVPQSHGLLPTLTAADNVRLVCDLRGQRTDHRSVLDALARFGVASLSHRRAGTLSVGQCQRVALSSGLFGEPAIVFLDEPTAAIQANNAREFMALARDYSRSANAIVMVACHDLSLAAEFCDRFWLAAQGKVEELDLATSRSDWRSPQEVHRLTGLLSAALFPRNVQSQPTHHFTQKV